MKRFLGVMLLLSILVNPARAGESELIRWVDFDVRAQALSQALAADQLSQTEEKFINWIDILALAATRSGGKDIDAKAVKQAAEELKQDRSIQELLGKQYHWYSYYRRAYGAALGGLVGNYAIQTQDVQTGEINWKAQYGIKAFHPIAAGYSYTHYKDFGASRSYGFARRHLGNDLMGALGTPIVAVESGRVEALGWNRYGGWRVGIRSDDNMRYYYYAHLQKDHPFADGLQQGQHVTGGDVIGFMGRSGYSATENVNNINVVHLHFGLQLIFDESQKECDNEIWIDVYDILEFLNAHRSSVRWDSTQKQWVRIYPFRDLD